MKKIFIIFMIVTFVVGCKRSEVKWDATGAFEATEVMVSAQNTGQIMALNVLEGDSLVSGQWVGYIDTTELALNRQQLLRTRAGVLVNGMDVPEQLASLDQQIAWQRSERERFAALVAADAATQKQLDDIDNQIAVLVRQRSAEYLRLTDGNSSLQRQAEALDFQIEQIGYRIAQSAVVAPIGGTVLVKYLEAGEFAGAGRPIFSMADLSRIYLRAYVTSDMLKDVKLGQKVKVYADFGDKNYRDYPGVVTWISSTAEFTPKTIQTASERADMVYAVKVAIVNDGYVKIGMYGLLTFQEPSE